MSENVPNRPYSNANTIVQDILNQLFGLIPGVGPLLSQLLSPMAANYLAPPDSMLSQYIWGGNGPRSAAFAYMNTLQNRSWGSGANAIDEAAAYRVHMAYAKTMHPEATPQELANLVANSMSNSFSIPSLIQMLLDPYKVSQGTAMARTVASSLQSRGAGFNIRGAEYAAQISSTLFGGKDLNDRNGGSIKGILNEILEDPSQYGNMSMADVMAVARELSTTKNYSIRGGKDIKFDSDGFKRDVQNLSKALEPWKEIFGKDIPQLMGQLEALTGRSVGSQASSLHNTALNMMSTLHVTGAKIQHIAAYRDAIAPALMDQTQTNRSILGAHNVATDMVLGLSNISVKALTTQELQQIGGVFYTGTAKSQFADSFALAYAAWLDIENEKADQETDSAKRAARKALLADPTKAREEFYSAYQTQRMQSGSNHQTALESLAGGRSLRDLEMYRYTDGHLDMVESGMGGRVSREEILRQSAESVQKYLNTSNTIMDKDLSIEEVNELLSLDQSAKIRKIRELNPQLSMADATKIAHTISTRFGEYYRYQTGINISDVGVQALQSTQINEQKQRRLAEQHKTFLKAAGEMSSVSGLEGVIRKLYENGGNTDLTAAIKAYAGGNDYARLTLEAMAADTGGNLRDLMNIGKEPTVAEYTDSFGNFRQDKFEEDYADWKAKNDRITRYTRAVNFMNNNFAELATTYKPIHDLLISKRKAGESDEEYKTRANENRIKALNQFAMLNQIDRKALAGMTKADRDNLATYLGKLKGDDEAKIQTLKDHVLDSGFANIVEKMQKVGHDDHVKASNLLKWMKEEGNVHTSKEELMSALKSEWAAKNNLTGDWEKNKKNADKVKEWNAQEAKYKEWFKTLGDIDKADPMKSIVSAIEKLVGFVEDIKNKVGGTK